ncbi:DUF5406 family protein [Symbiopectobacterium sp.]|uniref:DUF5406 family protein n=1 Tax=Symbiopectobacterium sp. TaxID=2952789 RepID=UPI003F3510A6
MRESSSQPPFEGDVLNYDPNIAALRVSRQRVELTFGRWDFRVTTVVAVTCHRCSGLNVIEQAIATVYSNLPSYTYEGEKMRCLLLEREEDIPLECRDEEGQGEEWLQDMLISAEIIDVAPAQ